MVNTKRRMKIQEQPQEEQERSMIPNDLIMDILSRLPARSVMRFRCVSKFWYSLTHDPYFIDMHLFHAKKLTPALLMNKYLEDSDVNPRFHLHSLVDFFQFVKPKAFATIENKHPCVPSRPCNGMICNNGINSSVDVINLTTQESITILKSTRSMAKWGFDTIHLTFHPSTKEYKLVQYYYMPPYDERDRDPTCRFEILTLGSDSWRLIGGVPYWFYFVDDGICVDGTMYFIVFVGEDKASLCIISLDLGDEKFKPVIPPPCFEEYPDVYDYNLHVVNGNLCLSKRFRHQFMDDVMDIWVLKECWSKDYRIVRPVTTLDGLRLITIFGEEALLYGIWTRELWYYHLGNESSRVVKYDEMNSTNLVGTYVETLVSLEKFKMGKKAPDSSSSVPNEEL